MKALVSPCRGSTKGGTSDCSSFSVGYFLNLVQVICVQSFYFLIWGKEKNSKRDQHGVTETHTQGRDSTAGREETQVSAT